MNIGKGLGSPLPPLDPIQKDAGKLRHGRAPLGPLHGNPSANGGPLKIVGKSLDALTPLQEKVAAAMSGISEKISLYFSQHLDQENPTDFLGAAENLRVVEDLAQNVAIGENVSGTVDILRRLISEPIGDHSCISDRVCNGNPYANLGMSLAAFQHKVESLIIIFQAKSLGFDDLGANGKEVSVLGRGACNTVFQTQTADGEAVVFKASEEAKSAEAGGAIPFTYKLSEIELWFGISGAGSMARNCATKQLAVLLGHPEVVVEAKPAIIRRQAGDQRVTETGLVMPLAPGRPVAKLSKTGEIPHEPSARYSNLAVQAFRSQATWLQLIDCLSGQVDRHAGNVFWDRASSQLTGIDHDLSFPTAESRPAFATQLPQFLGVDGGKDLCFAMDGWSARNFCMPPVIDRAMYRAIMELDLGVMRAKLGKLPFGFALAPLAIDAAIVRAGDLKQKAEAMLQNRCVIPDGEWATNETVKKQCTRNNTYFLRLATNPVGGIGDAANQAAMEVAQIDDDDDDEMGIKRGFSSERTDFRNNYEESLREKQWIPTPLRADQDGVIEE